MIKEGKLITPHADACLPGITRRKVLELAGSMNIPTIEKNISLTEMYNAETVFTTGTMGELTPVDGIDGRRIMNSTVSGIFSRIQQGFNLLTKTAGEKLPF